MFNLPQIKTDWAAGDGIKASDLAAISKAADIAANGFWLHMREGADGVQTAPIVLPFDRNKSLYLLYAARFINADANPGHVRLYVTRANNDYDVIWSWASSSERVIQYDLSNAPQFSAESGDGKTLVLELGRAIMRVDFASAFLYYGTR